MKAIATSLILLVLLALPLNALAQSPSSILQQAMDEVRNTLNDPAFAGPEMEQVKADKLVAIIKSVFDFELICRLTVANHWKNFSQDQQTRFVDAFEQLLQATYLRSILKNTDVSVQVLGEKELNTNKYEVEATVTSDTQQEPVPMFFRMVFKEEWRVYDVVVEGVSLVKNYRTQFQELLRSNSPDDVIAILLDKAAKAEAGELDETGSE